MRTSRHPPPRGHYPTNIRNLPRILHHQLGPRSLLTGTPQNPRRALQKDIVKSFETTKRGDTLTILEVRDCLQDMAGRVEWLWFADSTGGVPARVQDNLGIDEVPR